MSVATAAAVAAQSTTITVPLGARAYDIHVGRGLLGRAAELFTPVLKQRRVFIVTDSTVAPLYLEPLKRNLLQAGIRADSAVVTAGEASKDFDHVAQVTGAMLAAKCERATTVVALGGGVVGDLAGFAASILLRGIDFIQVPTTLLAQVDSSVGGKTGINTTAGKNLIGSFYQPRLVLADTDTLATLPRRQLLAGYAEVAKYGLLGDAAFWEWLEKNAATALSPSGHDPLGHCIATSCEAKARIVAADERENGVRALLNLGHTFGHALEAECGFSDRLLHGEAVAIGMVLAFDLSARLGLCPAADVKRVRAHLEAIGLPVRPPAHGARGPITAARLLEHMSQDKKNRDGSITFILARRIGEAFVARDVAPAQIEAALSAALGS